MKDEIMGEIYGGQEPPTRKNTWKDDLEGALFSVLAFFGGVGEWLRENFMILFLLGGLGVAMALMVFSTDAEQKAKKAHEASFMSECQQDRKHYECEAMWRAGEDHEHMIPVVIPMPSGR